MPAGRPRKPFGEVIAHRPQTLDDAKRVWELRAAGATIEAIAPVLGVSVSRVNQLIAIARTSAVVAPQAVAKDDELSHLLEIRAALQRIANDVHPLVTAGVIVKAPVIDPTTAQPIVDPTTGEPYMVPLQDAAPRLAALKALVDLSARISKLMGHDSPKRSETTATTTHRHESALKDVPAADLPALMRAALKSVTLQPVDVMDVDPIAVEVSNG